MANRISSSVSTHQLTILVASFFVALGSGTNYIYSAYAPQLGAHLNISFTQLNIVGLAGNAGVYASAAIWGRIADLHGPRILLLVCFVLLLSGYSGIKFIYDAGLSPGTSTLPALSFYLLVLCSFFTGSGSIGGLTSSVNATAKSFPDKIRASAIGLVIAGFGLSAFFFTALSNTIFSSTTSTLLLILALGTSCLMLLGFLFIRGIPLPQHPSSQSLEDGDDFRATFLPAVQNDSRTPLLNNDPMQVNYTRTDIDTSNGEHSNTVGSIMEAPQVSSQKLSTPLNIHGKALLRNVDFWLLFCVFSLFVGTGFTYINNVGTISRSLYAHNNPQYDDEEALRWQAAQVSVISLTNFGGRLLIGLLADLAKNLYKTPRSHFLVLVAFLFLISQVVVATISNISNLWIGSVLLGLAHGSQASLLPAVCLEWFGLPHFSENFGYICLSPLFSVNLLSFLFGQSLDAHAGKLVEDLFPTRFFAYGPPSCLEGRECYVDAIYLTIGASLLSLFVSLWAGYRDSCKAANKSVVGEEDN